MILEVPTRHVPLAGPLIAGLALTAAATIALPVSHSDLGRQEGVDTAYPLMLLPALAVVALAGLAASLCPAAAQVATVVSGITGLQVLGIAVVAARDWRNLAGVGHASWDRGNVASLVAVGMVFAALIIVAASHAIHRNGNPMPGVPRGYLVAGLIVAVGLPLVLSAMLHHVTPTAVGQFTLWWSAPWGAGIIAAGVAQEQNTRRAALATVLVSVALTCLCALAGPMFGFGLRLPEG